MTSFRVLLALTVSQGWSIDQLDITNTFLHGDFMEDVFMTLPPDYTPSEVLKRYPGETLCCNDVTQLQVIKQFLSSQFKVKDSGTFFPPEQNHALMAAQDVDDIPDANLYRRIVGRLVNPTISRPDIAYKIHTL
ncbi:uncharacterized protein LOC141685035 [Apium graveolens]|uniref:uncharacterized protein LOC141685035 n=1 Tax=Apium graveolens TaxID=4045 RepID=UPI003D7AD21A